MKRWKAFLHFKKNPVAPFLQRKARDWHSDKILGVDIIVQFFHSHERLKSLALNQDDIDSYIGRPFQIELSRHYLIRLDKELTLRIHNDNCLLFEFNHINSKFCASKTRKVILNFRNCFSDLANPDDSNPLNDRAFDSIGSPKIKSLQCAGDCKSGLRMVLPCAHGSAILQLIYHAIAGTLQSYLNPSPKHKQIRSSIIDCLPAKLWIRENDKRLYCICLKEYDGEEFLMNCGSCKGYCHPPCVGIDKNRLTLEQFDAWCCPSCVFEYDIDINV